MKLVKMRGGRPEPEPPPIKVVYSPESPDLLVSCPCGVSFTATLPPDGQQSEVECPKGCGHGVMMDRRKLPEYGPPAFLPAARDVLWADWLRRYFGFPG